MANTPTTNELRQKYRTAERRRDTAARRVKWLEAFVMLSTSQAEFESRNSQLEAALDEVEIAGAEAMRARIAFNNADLRERFQYPQA